MLIAFLGLFLGPFEDWPWRTCKIISISFRGRHFKYVPTFHHGKNWHDYHASDVIIPVFGWLIAIIVGIHSIWLTVTQRRLIIITLYGIVTCAFVILYFYNGVQNLRSNRARENETKTLLAVSGVSPRTGINQGLTELITRTLQPRNIIPTQEEYLANSIELIKSSLPNDVFVTMMEDSPDGYPIVLAIRRAFSRNGIHNEFRFQRAMTPRETGIMFSMPDPTNPPAFALPLRDAFSIMGIRDIRFVKMEPEWEKIGFTIFVGPAPLQ